MRAADGGAGSLLCYSIKLARTAWPCLFAGLRGRQKCNKTACGAGRGALCATGGGFARLLEARTRLLAVLCRLRRADACLHENLTKWSDDAGLPNWYKCSRL